MGYPLSVAVLQGRETGGSSTGSAVKHGHRAPGIEGVDGAPGVHIAIRPRRVLVVMLAIAGVLTAITITAHLIEPTASRSQDSSYLLALEIADGTVEHSLANWYSSLALLGCAGLMALIGLGTRLWREAYAGHWLGLAALFVFLAIDEGIGLHDAAVAPLQDAFGFGGLLHSAWVVPWGILAILCAALYAGFLVNLAPGVRAAMVGAAALYLTSALVVEVVEWRIYDTQGASLPLIPYETLPIGEELGEMAALGLLAYGLLLQLMGARGGDIRVGVSSRTGRFVPMQP